MATVKFLSHPAPGLRIYAYSLGGTGTIDPTGYPTTNVFELFHTANITGLDGKFYFITKGTDNKKQADIIGVHMVDEDVIIDTSGGDTSGALVALSDISRSIVDRNPITFRFESESAPTTKTKSINGAAPVPCQGIVTLVDNGLPGNWYQLSFDESDRPKSGQVIYTFTNSTKTVRILLTIIGPAETVFYK